MGFLERFFGPCVGIPKRNEQDAVKQNLQLHGFGKDAEGKDATPGQLWDLWGQFSHHQSHINSPSCMARGGSSDYAGILGHPDPLVLLEFIGADEPVDGLTLLERFRLSQQLLLNINFCGVLPHNSLDWCSKHLHAAYRNCRAVRLVPRYANGALRSLLRCPTPAHYEALLAELLTVEPVLLAALKDTCLAVVEGTASAAAAAAAAGPGMDGDDSGGGGSGGSGGHPIIVLHPFPGTDSRVLLPLTIHPLIVRRAASTGVVQRRSAVVAGDAPPSQLLAGVVLRYRLSAGVGVMQEQLHRCLTALSGLPSSVTLLSADGRRVLYQNTASVRYMGLRQGLPPAAGSRAVSRRAAAFSSGGGGGGGGDTMEYADGNGLHDGPAGGGGGGTAAAGSCLPGAISLETGRGVGGDFSSGTKGDRFITKRWGDIQTDGSIIGAAGPGGFAGRTFADAGEGVLRELFALSPHQWREVVSELTVRRRWKGIVRVPPLLTRHVTEVAEAAAAEAQRRCGCCDGGISAAAVPAAAGGAALTSEMNASTAELAAADGLQSTAVDGFGQQCHVVGVPGAGYLMLDDESCWERLTVLHPPSPGAATECRGAPPPAAAARRASWRSPMPTMTAAAATTTTLPPQRSARDTAALTSAQMTFSTSIAAAAAAAATAAATEPPLQSPAFAHGGFENGGGGGGGALRHISAPGSQVWKARFTAPAAPPTPNPTASASASATATYRGEIVTSSGIPTASTVTAAAAATASGANPSIPSPKPKQLRTAAESYGGPIRTAMSVVPEAAASTPDEDERLLLLLMNHPVLDTAAGSPSAIGGSQAAPRVTTPRNAHTAYGTEYDGSLGVPYNCVNNELPFQRLASSPVTSGMGDAGAGVGAGAGDGDVGGGAAGGGGGGGGNGGGDVAPNRVSSPSLTKAVATADDRQADSGISRWARFVRGRGARPSDAANGPRGVLAAMAAAVAAAVAAPAAVRPKRATAAGALAVAADVEPGGFPRTQSVMELCSRHNSKLPGASGRVQQTSRTASVIAATTTTTTTATITATAAATAATVFATTSVLEASQVDAACESSSAAGGATSSEFSRWAGIGALSTPYSNHPGTSNHRNHHNRQTQRSSLTLGAVGVGFPGGGGGGSGGVGDGCISPTGRVMSQSVRQSIELRRNALGLCRTHTCSGGGGGGGIGAAAAAAAENPLSTSTWALLTDASCSAGGGGQALRRHTSFGAAILRAGGHVQQQKPPLSAAAAAAAAAVGAFPRPGGGGGGTSRGRGSCSSTGMVVPPPPGTAAAAAPVRPSTGGAAGARGGGAVSDVRSSRSESGATPRPPSPAAAPEASGLAAEIEDDVGADGALRRRRQVGASRQALMVDVIVVQRVLGGIEGSGPLSSLHAPTAAAADVDVDVEASERGYSTWTPPPPPPPPLALGTTGSPRRTLQKTIGNGAGFAATTAASWTRNGDGGGGAVLCGEAAAGGGVTASGHGGQSASTSTSTLASASTSAASTRVCSRSVRLPSAHRLVTSGPAGAGDSTQVQEGTQELMQQQSPPPPPQQQQQSPMRWQHGLQRQQPLQPGKINEEEDENGDAVAGLSAVAVAAVAVAAETTAAGGLVDGVRALLVLREEGAPEVSSAASRADQGAEETQQQEQQQQQQQQEEEEEEEDKQEKTQEEQELQEEDGGREKAGEAAAAAAAAAALRVSMDREWETDGTGALGMAARGGCAAGARNSIGGCGDGGGDGDGGGGGGSVIEQDGDEFSDGESGGSGGSSSSSSGCWHEVTLTLLEGEGEMAAAATTATAGGGCDGGGGVGMPLLLLMQTDVTARVRAERRIARVLEAEHQLLESIFPRHVLELAAASVRTSNNNNNNNSCSKNRCSVIRSSTGAGPNRNRGGGGPRSGRGCAARYRLTQLPLPQNSASTATYHPMVTVLFADIKGFTSLCHQIPPTRVMHFLNHLYSRLDTLLDVYGVYKVETIGDCYMVAGGLMTRDSDGFMAVRGPDSVDELHAAKVMAFAKAMLREASRVLLPTTRRPVEMRIGLHSGAVMSGIVGAKMPRFCLFGDTVNTASRMESTCTPGAIHVSAATRALLPEEEWEPTGGVQVKGIGVMSTFRWVGGGLGDEERTSGRALEYGMGMRANSGPRAAAAAAAAAAVEAVGGAAGSPAMKRSSAGALRTHRARRASTAAIFSSMMGLRAALGSDGGGSGGTASAASAAAAVADGLQLASVANEGDGGGGGGGSLGGSLGGAAAVGSRCGSGAGIGDGARGTDSTAV